MSQWAREHPDEDYQEHFGLKPVVPVQQSDPQESPEYDPDDPESQPGYWWAVNQKADMMREERWPR